MKQRKTVLYLIIHENMKISSQIKALKIKLEDLKKNKQIIKKDTKFLTHDKNFRSTENLTVPTQVIKDMKKVYKEIMIKKTKKFFDGKQLFENCFNFESKF